MWSNLLWIFVSFGIPKTNGSLKVRFYPDSICFCIDCVWTFCTILFETSFFNMLSTSNFLSFLTASCLFSTTYTGMVIVISMSVPGPFESLSGAVIWVSDVVTSFFWTLHFTFGDTSPLILIPVVLLATKVWLFFYASFTMSFLG